jgi:ATP-binding cassette, subfamily C, bacterial CydC
MTATTSTTTSATTTAPDGGRPGWRRDPLVRAVLALEPDWWRTAGAVLAGAAALGCAIGLLASSAWMISRAAQRPSVVVLSVAVVAVRAMGVGRGVLRYVERLVSHDVALRGVARLRETVYARLAAADSAVVAGLRTGDLLARVGADVDALADVVVRGLLPFGVAAVTGLAVVGLLLPVLPSAALLVLVSLLVAGVLAPWLAGRAAARAERDAAAARAEITGQVHAVVEGLPELTVAGVVGDRLDRVADADRRLAAALDASARPTAVASALVTLATLGGMVGSLALGVQAVGSGRLAEVMLAVVTLTPLAAAEAVAGLPAAAAGLVRARVAAGRVVALLDAAPRPDAAPEPLRDVTSGPIPDPTPDDAANGVRPAPVRPFPEPLRLRASGLDCGWPGHPVAVRGVDLDLAPGRAVAVVGSSGIGKTTLLLTLAGLLPLAGGAVTLSGPGSGGDLAGLDQARLRATVSYTAEDAHVFTTTVRENLRVAVPGSPDQPLVDALHRAGLDEWLAQLPRGLDTMLGTGGTGLSGGERRRLLLARALLVGAPVVLLDEPAEHLDPQTADRLVGDLLRAGPAVVLVTHRLAALEAADEVLVLGHDPAGGPADDPADDPGGGGAERAPGPARVLARGSHDWLLQHHEPYRAALLAELGSVAV